MPEKLYCLEITAEEAAYERILALLAMDAAFGWEEKSLPTGETVFKIHCENHELLERISSAAESMNDANAGSITCRMGVVAQTNWLEAWKEFFTPVLCGTRFVVLPPWLAGSDYDKRTKIIIEPKSAFGTGHHATTVLCLEALDELADNGVLEQGKTFLDIGCGSGILGIAAAKCGMGGLGVDIDELAIANAAENRAINNVDALELKLGGVEDRGNNTFDLVTANILARPLIELAPQISASLNPGGWLILSGILDIQADSVENSYIAQGLKPVKRIAKDEWRAIMLHQHC